MEWRCLKTQLNEPINEPQKQLQRIGIFQQVRSLKESILLGSDFEGHGECFWWTACGAIVLRRYGLKPVIQAGDAQWPILDPKCDDGKCSTHFSYMWSERDPNVSKMNMLLGGLPEIHTWLGLVETQELIDFSTGGIREQAEKHGLKWTAPDLPNFIWSNSKEVPEEE